MLKMLLSFLNLTDRMRAHALAWCTNHHYYYIIYIFVYIVIWYLLYTKKTLDIICKKWVKLRQFINASYKLHGIFCYILVHVTQVMDVNLWQ